MKRANDIEIGEECIIKSFDDEVLACRFLELGIIPGYPIKLMRTTSFKETYYVQIKQLNFALRKGELNSIILEET